MESLNFAMHQGFAELGAVASSLLVQYSDPTYSADDRVFFGDELVVCE